MAQSTTAWCRWPLAIGTAALLCGNASAPAQEAQGELNALLSSASRDEIAKGRAACATGNAGSWQQMLRESGFQSPPPGAWCVTVLTRAGRDGTLRYVRDPNASGLSPSFAFDNGFVGGYLDRIAIPATAPPMAALLPVADRCLRQQEPNTKLCTAAGYMLGARTAHGEVVALR